MCSRSNYKFWLDLLDQVVEFNQIDGCKIYWMYAKSNYMFWLDQLDQMVKSDQIESMTISIEPYRTQQNQGGIQKNRKELFMGLYTSMYIYELDTYIKSKP